jgi:molybdenum cofactor synthesis domain-containing protein
MKPIEEARATVLAEVKTLPSEHVAIWDSLDRVLASDVVAPENVPPFDNSAMDGYAVRGADVVSPGAVLDVVDDLPAGVSPQVSIGSGQAAKIMTGAPIPKGADTVVKVEDTEPGDGVVSIGPAVESGTSVRPAGGDLVEGQPVFSAGTRLTPMHVGVLATIGISDPLVYQRPRVAYMSTGDELAPVDGGPLEPGMIRDSNRPMLKALLEAASVELIDMGVIPDDEQILREALDEASKADAIVSTGGVSMGDYDVTKLVLSGEADVEFWKIAMQPAKPFAFGHIGDALFFGLPGNPVSVLVAFEQFARPALLKMQGSKAIFRPRVLAVADEDFSTDPAKTVFVRVRVTREEAGRIHVVRSGGQSSNVLSAAAAADAFAVVPVGTESVRMGEDVMIELFRSPEAREESDG